MSSYCRAVLGLSIGKAKYRQQRAAHESQRQEDIGADCTGRGERVKEFEISDISDLKFQISNFKSPTLRYTSPVRIIAGEFRGRRLLGPGGDVTRPITDRVKQSLFDILQPSIAGAEVFDLFAGTGSMGLECLSRGAKRATFFEADRSAIARLRTNIADLRVEASSRVVAGDLFRWFERTAKVGVESADLIFLDPPYRFLRERPDEIRLLTARLADCLRPEGVVIFRHDAEDRLELPPLTRYDERAYGGMTLEFLQRVEAAPKTGVSGGGTEE